DSTEIAIFMNNLAITYMRQEEHQIAMEYLKKALLIQEAVGHKEGTTVSLTNMGDVYSDLKNYKEAIVYYVMAMEVAEKFKDNRAITYITANIGKLYLGLAKDEAATGKDGHIAVRNVDRKGF